MTSLPNDQHNLESYQKLIARFAAHGLKIYRLANNSCHNMDEVTLNLPGRDAKIEEYLRPQFQKVYTMSFDNYPTEMERLRHPHVVEASAEHA